jgi:two-component system cell cycle sensor histidine kinase/response regulator CckA
MSYLGRGSGTILVADDDAAILEVTGKLLELAGYTVLLAEDSESVVETLRENADVVRVVILDLTMPGAEGGQNVDYLRKVVPDIPIIVMTGYPEPQTRQKLGTREVAAFLEKPFQPPELFKLLQTLLGEKEE